MDQPHPLQSAPKVQLIPRPTPVQPLLGTSPWAGRARLFVKREDATDHVYGGNKVRNLEYILGAALAQGARRLVTLAPLGSNFVAALAAQAGKIGMPVDVCHFVPAQSELIRAQARFSAIHGARLNIFRGGRYLGATQAQLSTMARSLGRKHVYTIAPGGSSVTGILGHVNAVFELQKQIQRGEIPEPDFIVVGVGTCGTLAGLLVGLRLTRLKSKVIGVRCVDAIICNRRRVRQLANGTLRYLQSRQRLNVGDINLCDVGGVYGLPIDGAAALMAEVRAASGLVLDTTYTTKVFSFLKAAAGAGHLDDRDVLYWNTFSPKALESRGLRSVEAFERPRSGTRTQKPLAIAAR